MKVKPENKTSYEDLEKLIKEYEAEGNKTVELNIKTVLSLIDNLKVEESKNIILNIQKYNLIMELKNRGVSEETIKKILKEILMKGKSKNV